MLKINICKIFECKINLVPIRPSIPISKTLVSWVCLPSNPDRLQLARTIAKSCSDPHLIAIIYLFIREQAPEVLGLHDTGLGWATRTPTTHTILCTSLCCTTATESMSMQFPSMPSNVVPFAFVLAADGNANASPVEAVAGACLWILCGR